jgi:hypothetical protein
LEYLYINKKKQMELRKFIANTIREYLNENNGNNEIIAYHGTTDKGYGTYKYTYYTADYEYEKNMLRVMDVLRKLK